METRDATDIIFKSLQSVLQQPNLQNEIKHLKKVFKDINDYLNWIIEQSNEKVKNQNKMTRSTQLTTNTECKITYTGTNLASKFNIKDKISKEQKRDLIYKAQRPDLDCDETYIGEIGRRFSERIIDHSGRDDKSHLYEHAEKTGDGNVNIDHFKILSNGYRNNKFKRKLAEALHIKRERPTMNVQEQSVPLKLFNSKSIEA